MRIYLIIRRFIKKLLGYFDSVFYICGSDTLPEPLKREEEMFYLNLLKEGDVKAKNILIEHNLRLVVYIAKKYDNTKLNIEDLISIGTIGLIKGINTFNVDKNIKLATYASRCIENEILMHLRKISKQKAEISFDEPLNIDWDGNELLLSDILGTDEDIVTKNLDYEVERNLVLDEIDKLNERDRKIMILRFGLRGVKSMTQKDVACLLGISQSYISRIEKKIIKKMREDLQKIV